MTAAHSALTKLLAHARSVVTANGGSPDVVLAEADAAARRESDAKAAGNLDEALADSQKALVVTKANMRGFLESLIGKYATIAQRKMNANELDVAEMAINKGKELKRLESDFN
jgi:hypothetical protein